MTTPSTLRGRTYPPLPRAMAYALVVVGCGLLMREALQPHVIDGAVLVAIAGVPGVLALLACLRHVLRLIVSAWTGLDLTPTGVTWRRLGLTGLHTETRNWSQVTGLRLDGKTLILEGIAPLKIRLAPLLLPPDQALRGAQALLDQSRQGPLPTEAPLVLRDLACPGCRSPLTFALSDTESLCGHCGARSALPGDVAEALTSLRQRLRAEFDQRREIEHKALSSLLGKLSTSRKILIGVGWGIAGIFLFGEIGGIANYLEDPQAWTSDDTLLVFGMLACAGSGVAVGYGLARFLRWVFERASFEVRAVEVKDTGTLACRSCAAPLEGQEPVHTCGYCGAVNIVVRDGKGKHPERLAAAEAVARGETDWAVGSAAQALDRITTNLTILAALQVLWVQAPLLACLDGAFDMILFTVLPGVALVASNIATGLVALSWTTGAR